MTEDDLAAIELRADNAHTESWYNQDVTALIGEVRRLQRIDGRYDVYRERDAARKAARTWKAATKWYRASWSAMNVMHQGALSTIRGQAKEVSRLAKQVHAVRKQARAWKSKALAYRAALNFPVNSREYWKKQAKSWRDEYWKVFDERGELRKHIVSLAESASVPARTEAYTALLRLVEFRPRIRASSEVSR